MLQKENKTQQESFHQAKPGGRRRGVVRKIGDRLLIAMEIQTLPWDFTALGPVWSRRDVLGPHGTNVTHRQAVAWQEGAEGMPIGIFKGGKIHFSSSLHL